MSAETKILLVAQDIYDVVRITGKTEIDKYKPSKQLSDLLSVDEYERIVRFLYIKRHCFSGPPWNVGALSSQSIFPTYRITVNVDNLKHLLSIGNKEMKATLEIDMQSLFIKVDNIRHEVHRFQANSTPFKVIEYCLTGSDNNEVTLDKLKSLGKAPGVSNLKTLFEKYETFNGKNGLLKAFIKLSAKKMSITQTVSITQKEVIRILEFAKKYEQLRIS